MAANMYRVGDYVYFEITSSAPYQIRRIEELNRTPSGNVEAKVMTFSRRRDVNEELLKVADQDVPVSNGECTSSSNNAESGKDKPSDTAVNSASAEAAETEDKSPAAVSPKPDNQPKDTDTDTQAQSSAETQGDTDQPMDTDTDTVKDKDQDIKAEEPTPEGEQTTPDAPQDKDSVVEESSVSVSVPVDNANTDGKDTAKRVFTKKPPRPFHGGLPSGSEKLTEEEKHQLRHRELFLSRQIETLPATHIRGKCSVTVLNEMETPDTYNQRQDSFFYSLVYDPTQKTLLADKGEIRVGEKYQGVPQPLLPLENREGDRPEQLDTCVFRPDHDLSDRDIDQFLIVARAVGTFSRALDTSSSVKLPSLHMAAAAASRDVTLLHAMALLHHAKYDLGQAMKYLVPPPSKQHYPLETEKSTGHHTVSLGGPILCRDQLEEWSAAEANLFEEAIEKYGKDFNDIRHDFLPWKSHKDIVEYYYMWKTTDRYVQQKRAKAIEAESKLKQVYIPNYNKQNPNIVGPANASGQAVPGTRPCDSCKLSVSVAWYAWGPPNLQLRLCNDCWVYWKKYGGLKCKHEHENYDKIQQQMTGVAGAASVALTNASPATAGFSIMNASRGIMPQAQTQHQTHSIAAITGQQRSAVTSQRQSSNHRGAILNPNSSTNMANNSKGRTSIFLNTTWLTRIARRLAPKPIYNARKAARRPQSAINHHSIKLHCQSCTPMQLLTVAKVIKGGRLPEPLLKLLSAGAQGGNQQNRAQTNGNTVTKRPLQNGDSTNESMAPQAKKEKMMENDASNGMSGNGNMRH